MSNMYAKHRLYVEHVQELDIPMISQRTQALSVSAYGY